MKNIALLLALIFAQSSFAGWPPTTIKGQGDASKSTNFNFQVPAKQATKVATGTTLIETNNSNLLTNPGFEHSTAWTGWTLSTTGTPLVSNNFTDDPLLVYPDGGKKSLNLACAGGASGGTCSYIQEVTTLETAGAARGCLSISTGATVSLFSLVNGGRQTELSVTDGDLVDDGRWHCYEIPMVMGATSSGVEIEVTVAASETPTIYADKMEVGAGKLVGESSNISEWEDFTPTGSWTGAVVYSGKWRRVGDSAEIQFSVKATGAPTGSGLTFDIPSFIGVMDLNKLNLDSAGHYYVGKSGETYDFGVGRYAIDGFILSGASSITIYQSKTSSEANPARIVNGIGSVTPTSPFTFGVDDSVKIEIRIPIKGFSASTTTYSQQVQSDLEVTNEFVADVGLSGVVSNEPKGLDWISGDCSITGTSTFNCSYSSNLTNSAMVCRPSQSSSNIIPFTVSSTSTGFSVNTRRNTDNTEVAGAFSIECSRSGDFKASKSIKGTFKDHVKSIGSSTGADIQSVYFGAGADCATACSSGSCTICSQVGTKITSVTLQTTGTYRINGIDGTKYNCQLNGHVSGTSYVSGAHARSGSTSTYATIIFGTGTTGYNVNNGTATCTGDLE